MPIDNNATPAGVNASIAAEQARQETAAADYIQSGAAPTQTESLYEAYDRQVDEAAALSSAKLSGIITGSAQFTEAQQDLFRQLQREALYSDDGISLSPTSWDFDESVSFVKSGLSKINAAFAEIELYEAAAKDATYGANADYEMALMAARASVVPLQKIRHDLQVIKNYLQMSDSHRSILGWPKINELPQLEMHLKRIPRMYMHVDNEIRIYLGLEAGDKRLEDLKSDLSTVLELVQSIYDQRVAKQQSQEEPAVVKVDVTSEPEVSSALVVVAETAAYVPDDHSLAIASANLVLKQTTNEGLQDVLRRAIRFMSWSQMQKAPTILADRDDTRLRFSTISKIQDAIDANDSTKEQVSNLRHVKAALIKILAASDQNRFSYPDKIPDERIGTVDQALSAIKESLAVLSDLFADLHAQGGMEAVEPYLDFYHMFQVVADGKLDPATLSKSERSKLIRSIEHLIRNHDSFTRVGRIIQRANTAFVKLSIKDELVDWSVIGAAPITHVTEAGLLDSSGTDVTQYAPGTFERLGGPAGNGGPKALLGDGSSSKNEIIKGHFTFKSNAAPKLDRANLERGRHLRSVVTPRSVHATNATRPLSRARALLGHSNPALTRSLVARRGWATRG